jgi:hypothetical protein
MAGEKQRNHDVCRTGRREAGTLLLRAGTREKIQDKACSDSGGMSGQGAKKRRMMEYTI